MTNEQINIAIAKACGWKHYHEDLWVDPDFNGDPDGFSELQCGDFPDYCNDLNAMHEAEKVLNDEQKERYFFNLMCLYGNWPKAIQATSTERAEAFLKTIGEWEE